MDLLRNAQKHHFLALEHRGDDRSRHARIAFQHAFDAGREGLSQSEMKRARQMLPKALVRTVLSGGKDTRRDSRRVNMEGPWRTWHADIQQPKIMIQRSNATLEYMESKIKTLKRKLAKKEGQLKNMKVCDEEKLAGLRKAVQDIEAKEAEIQRMRTPVDSFPFRQGEEEMIYVYGDFEGAMKGISAEVVVRPVSKEDEGKDEDDDEATMKIEYTHPEYVKKYKYMFDDDKELYVDFTGGVLDFPDVPVKVMEEVGTIGRYMDVCVKKEFDEIPSDEIMSVNGVMGIKLGTYNLPQFNSDGRFENEKQREQVHLFAFPSDDETPVEERKPFVFHLYFQDFDDYWATVTRKGGLFNRNTDAFLKTVTEIGYGSLPDFLSNATDYVSYNVLTGKVSSVTINGRKCAVKVLTKEPKPLAAGSSMTGEELEKLRSDKNWELVFEEMRKTQPGKSCRMSASKEKCDFQEMQEWMARHIALHPQTYNDVDNSFGKDMYIYFFKLMKFPECFLLKEDMPKVQRKAILRKCKTESTWDNVLDYLNDIQKMDSGKLADAIRVMKIVLQDMNYLIPENDLPEGWHRGVDGSQIYYWRYGEDGNIISTWEIEEENEKDDEKDDEKDEKKDDESEDEEKDEDEKDEEEDEDDEEDDESEDEDDESEDEDEEDEEEDEYDEEDIDGTLSIIQTTLDAIRKGYVDVDCTAVEDWSAFFEQYREYVETVFQIGAVGIESLRKDSRYSEIMNALDEFESKVESCEKKKEELAALQKEKETIDYQIESAKEIWAMKHCKNYTIEEWNVFLQNNEKFFSKYKEKHPDKVPAIDALIKYIEQKISTCEDEFLEEKKDSIRKMGKELAKMSLDCDKKLQNAKDKLKEYVLMIEEMRKSQSDFSPLFEPRIIQSRIDRKIQICNNVIAEKKQEEEDRAFIDANLDEIQSINSVACESQEHDLSNLLSAYKLTLNRFKEKYPDKASDITSNLEELSRVTKDCAEKKRIEKEVNDQIEKLEELTKLPCDTKYWNILYEKYKLEADQFRDNSEIQKRLSALQTRAAECEAEKKKIIAEVEKSEKELVERQNSISISISCDSLDKSKTEIEKLLQDAKDFSARVRGYDTSDVVTKTLLLQRDLEEKKKSCERKDAFNRAKAERDALYNIATNLNDRIRRAECNGNDEIERLLNDYAERVVQYMNQYEDQQPLATNVVPETIRGEWQKKTSQCQSEQKRKELIDQLNERYQKIMEKIERYTCDNGDDTVETEIDEYERDVRQFTDTYTVDSNLKFAGPLRSALNTRKKKCMADKQEKLFQTAIDLKKRIASSDCSKTDGIDERIRNYADRVRQFLKEYEKELDERIAPEVIRAQLTKKVNDCQLEKRQKEIAGELSQRFQAILKKIQAYSCDDDDSVKSIQDDIEKYKNDKQKPTGEIIGSIKELAANLSSALQSRQLKCLSEKKAKMNAMVSKIIGMIRSGACKTGEVEEKKKEYAEAVAAEKNIESRILEIEKEQKECAIRSVNALGKQISEMEPNCDFDLYDKKMKEYMKKIQRAIADHGDFKPAISVELLKRNRAQEEEVCMLRERVKNLLHAKETCHYISEPKNELSFLRASDLGEVVSRVRKAGGTERLCLELRMDGVRKTICEVRNITQIKNSKKYGKRTIVIASKDENDVNLDIANAFDVNEVRIFNLSGGAYNAAASIADTGSYIWSVRGGAKISGSTTSGDLIHLDELSTVLPQSQQMINEDSGAAQQQVLFDSFW